MDWLTAGVLAFLGLCYSAFAIIQHASAVKSWEYQRVLDDQFRELWEKIR